ncbi:MAG: thioredoxin family protein [Candidatus Kapaibacterium sp.]|nr:thioredoxin family protein [Ignavibacteriota bacterium]
MSIKERIANDNINLLVFQGSWCPMCVSAMPQIAQFVSTNGVDENSIEIINVNNTKSEPAERIAEYNITRVPTVIFLKDGNEVDRITEFAPSGWKTEIENKINSI